MPEATQPAGAPGVEQNRDGMFRCGHCGKLYSEDEMWAADQCLLCWEEECSDRWWRAVNEVQL